MRLLQQMQASFEASYVAAYDTANKIMNGNSKNLAIELGRNLERKILYSNPFMKQLRYNEFILNRKKDDRNEKND